MKAPWRYPQLSLARTDIPKLAGLSIGFNDPFYTFIHQSIFFSVHPTTMGLQSGGRWAFQGWGSTYNLILSSIAPIRIWSSHPLSNPPSPSLVRFFGVGGMFWPFWFQVDRSKEVLLFALDIILWQAQIFSFLNKIILCTPFAFML